jgi:hypothetical protein
MEWGHLVILDSSSHFQLLPSERRILLAAEYAKCKNHCRDATGPGATRLANLNGTGRSRCWNTIDDGQTFAAGND